MPVVRYQSDYFALRWEGTLVSDAQAQAATTLLESIWVNHTQTVGIIEPYCKETQKYKVNVHVNASFGLTGDGTDQKYPAFWCSPGGLNDPWGMAHEFTHSLLFASEGLRNSPYPHVYTGSTRDRYCNWPFLEHPKNRYCFDVVNKIWTESSRPDADGADQETPFAVIARIRGWSALEPGAVVPVCREAGVE